MQNNIDKLKRGISKYHNDQKSVVNFDHYMSSASIFDQLVNQMTNQIGKQIDQSLLIELTNVVQQQISKNNISTDLSSCQVSKINFDKDLNELKLNIEIPTPVYTLQFDYIIDEQIQQLKKY